MFLARLEQKSVCIFAAFFKFFDKYSLFVRQDFFLTIFKDLEYFVWLVFVGFKHSELLHKNILHEQERIIMYWNCVSFAIQFLIRLESLWKFLDKANSPGLFALSFPQGWKTVCTWSFRKFHVCTRHESKQWNANSETIFVKFWICWFILYNSFSCFYPIIWGWAVI